MSGENKQAHVFDAAQSVEYSANAVVSKTIVKKATGNITLFAFDKDEGLSEHSSPHDALVHILDGTAEITVGGEPFLADTGQCILLPANIPHALRALKKFKMMLTMIKS
jgi:quercetin dioxygenase-like cupin family protein